MKYKRNEFKNNNLGITLIALVITIIVLLILAGVTINLTLGENGVLIGTQEAKEQTDKAKATEKMNFKITTEIMNNYMKNQTLLSLQELENILNNDSEIEYINRKDGSTSIYVKLKEYKYEFEIDSSNKIVSISGEKISNEINEEELKEIKLKLNEIQNEFFMYRQKIVEIINKNGGTAIIEDLSKTIGIKINKTFETNYLAGVHSEFIKVAEGMSSRYNQQVNVSHIPNYDKFSIDNFIIVNKSMEYAYGSDSEEVKVISKQYDKENGILTLGKEKSYTQARK